MSKVCNEHLSNPAKLYGQCIGCELERYQKRITELEFEIKALKDIGTNAFFRRN